MPRKGPDLPSSKKPVMCKRVEGQQTGMREEEEAVQQPVRRLLVGGRRAAAGGGRSRRAGSQVRQQQASEAGLKGSRGLGGLQPQAGAASPSPWVQCTFCRWEFRIQCPAFTIGKGLLSSKFVTL